MSKYFNEYDKYRTFMNLVMYNKCFLAGKNISLQHFVSDCVEKGRECDECLS